MEKKIKNIIWDWNGTLLDDIHVCVDSINILLMTRSLPLLDTDRYREIFTFPVKKYYEEAGFDFEREDFSKPAHEFMDHYREKVVSASLHEDTEATLSRIKRAGHRQFILSAMEKNLLSNLLDHFKIKDYFDGIYGIEDHYANGKEKAAELLINNHGIIPEEVVLIGDTLHDHEVASHLGIECILIANGHQSGDRLRSSGRKVIQSLQQVPSILL